MMHKAASPEGPERISVDRKHALPFSSSSAGAASAAWLHAAQAARRQSPPERFPSQRKTAPDDVIVAAIAGLAHAKADRWPATPLLAGVMNRPKAGGKPGRAPMPQHPFSALNQPAHIGLSGLVGDYLNRAGGGHAA